MSEDYNGKDLYDEEEINVMKKTFKAIISSKKSRIKEFIELCNELDFKKVGIAHCKSMEKYAEKLESILLIAGFDVSRVDCKIGKLGNQEFVEDAKGLSCNPAYQAKFLREAKTDINVNVGLCLGHELMFMKKSDVPVTTLVVKDFSTNHNTVCSLSD